MARFSVIVPVYNAAHTIERCVESIVASGGENVQIILIEDSSKDHSWQICCALAERYPCITALHNEQNRGVSYTRNKGLATATGEYILFCDSDDWVAPEWGATLLKEAQNSPHMMPVCGYYLEEGVGRPVRKCLWSEDGTIQKVELTQAFDLLDRVLLQQLWTKVFRREIITDNQIRFDETQSMGEDLQFVLDYLIAADLKGFSMINRPLYHYSCHTGTLMRNFGLVNRQEEYNRLLLLGQITGDRARCAVAIDILKKNQVYHILRSNLDIAEKRILAKEILGDKAEAYCRAQRLVILKERVRNMLPSRSKK